MGFLQQIYCRLFSREKNTAVVLCFSLLLLSFCSSCYSSSVTLYLTLGASLTLVLFLFRTLKVMALILFCLTAVTILSFFGAHWLDIIFTMTILTFVSYLALCHDIFTMNNLQENIKSNELKGEATLYKNRFDTMVFEYQKKNSEKEGIIEGHLTTLELQKERLGKLEILLEHQRVKCIEASRHVRSIEKELESLRESGSIFEQHCQQIADRMNNDQIRETRKKVPLVALRSHPKNKNKIKLTDLAKNVKL